ncbi:unnamed protein product [Choristocarpus tenellus]
MLLFEPISLPIIFSSLLLLLLLVLQLLLLLFLCIVCSFPRDEGVIGEVAPSRERGAMSIIMSPCTLGPPPYNPKIYMYMYIYYIAWKACFATNGFSRDTGVSGVFPFSQERAAMTSTRIFLELKVKLLYVVSYLIVMQPENTTLFAFHISERR